MSKRKSRQPVQPERLADEKIDRLDSIFPGFAAWYRSSHDEQGRLTTPVPGLRPTTNTPTIEGEPA